MKVLKNGMKWLKNNRYIEAVAFWTYFGNYLPTSFIEEKKNYNILSFTIIFIQFFKLILILKYYTQEKVIVFLIVGMG